MVDRFNLCYISTGDLLRKELKADTPFGQQAKDIISTGGLVSDEIIVQILEKTIMANPHANGFLFDGFPCTTIQLYILDGLLMKYGFSLSRILEIEVPMLKFMERLAQRGQSDKAMPYDQSTETIVHRLRDHEEKTLPVIHKYEQLHSVCRIDDDADVDTVYQRCAAEVETLFQVGQVPDRSPA